MPNLSDKRPKNFLGLVIEANMNHVTEELASVLRESGKRGATNIVQEATQASLKRSTNNNKTIFLQKLRNLTLLMMH